MHFQLLSTVIVIVLQLQALTRAHPINRAASLLNTEASTPAAAITRRSLQASQPPNTTLVHIAFLRPLNYPFVSSSTTSQNQIFTYLPQGIAYDLNIPTSSVTMQSLGPLDTSASLGYITTLAYAYIPQTMVNQLQLDVRSPSSRLYNNPNASVKSLMAQINPNIAIV